MDIKRDLPELIRTHIPSVWALEALLVLQRSAPRTWTAESLTQELRAALPLVSSTLAGLEKLGLVVQACSGAYVYAPATPLLSEFVSALDAQYKERPVAIINLIAAPPDRVQQLADAFRFRRGNNR